MDPDLSAVGNEALRHFGADLGLTLLAFFLASAVRPILPFGLPVVAELAHLSPLVYLLIALIWSGVLVLLAVYQPRIVRAVEEAQLVIAAVSLATLTLGGILYFSIRDVSRLQVLVFYLFDLFLLVGYRLVLRAGRTMRGSTPYDRRRVLIVAVSEAGRDVARMVERHRWAGLQMVGFLDDELPAGTTVGAWPVLGRVEEAARVVASEQVAEIVLTLPLRQGEQFYQLIAGLQAMSVRVRIVPDYIKTTLFRTGVEHFAGVPMITLRQPVLDPFERQVKRAFDLVLGGLGLLLALPLTVVIALAIRLDSPGPVLFRQQRVGENGRLFWMVKFRSMFEGADNQQPELELPGDRRRLLDKRPDDPRVTRVGKLLRRFSLDELPQLLNVLKGEMSLVGPRPELPSLVDQYEPWQRQRFSVPQGMTGWWQVSGRVDQPMYLHTEEDLYYLQHYSLWLDLQILWRTAAAVLRGQGAY